MLNFQPRAILNIVKAHPTCRAIRVSALTGPVSRELHLVCIFCLYMDRLRYWISQNNTYVLLSTFNNQLLKCAQTEKAVAACNIKHAQYK